MSVLQVETTVKPSSNEKASFGNWNMSWGLDFYKAGRVCVCVCVIVTLVNVTLGCFCCLLCLPGMARLVEVSIT
jgi:hypothetical protein